jgi:hypothetical protein
MFVRVCITIIIYNKIQTNKHTRRAGTTGDGKGRLRGRERNPIFSFVLSRFLGYRPVRVAVLRCEKFDQCKSG